MRGLQPALELGWAAIAEEPAALIGHGGICEGGESGVLPAFLYSETSSRVSTKRTETVAFKSGTPVCNMVEGSEIREPRRSTISVTGPVRADRRQRPAGGWKDSEGPRGGGVGR